MAKATMVIVAVYFVIIRQRMKMLNTKDKRKSEVTRELNAYASS